ncbi:MAG: calcium-binding protein [Pseudomonadota bacterium]
MAEDAGKPVTSLTNAVQLQIANISALLSQYAAAANISSLAIAAPIAREMNKVASNDYNHGPLFDAVGQEMMNAVALTGSIDGNHTALLTNQAYETDLSEVQVGGITNTQGLGYITQTLNRLENPVLNDVGVAKIQVGTAMEAVYYYASNQENFEGDDPLGLLKYANNTPQLVQDLINPATTLQVSAAIETVIAQQAISFGAGAVAGWNSLSEVQQAAFVAAYSTNPNVLESHYDEFLSNGGKPGFWQPDLTATVGALYFTTTPTGGGQTNGEILQNILSAPPTGSSDLVDPTLYPSSSSATTLAQLGDTSAESAGSITIQSSDGLLEILTAGGQTVDAGATGSVEIVDAFGGNTIEAGSAESAVLIGGNDSVLVGGANATSFQAEGQNVSITTGTGSSTIELDSTGAIVNAVAGSSNITDDGSNDTINAAAGSSITVNGIGGSIAVSNGDIDVGAGASFALVGSTNAVSVVESGGIALVLSGTGNSVTSSGNGGGSINTIALDGNGSTAAIEGNANVSLNGDNQSITVAAGASVDFNGSGGSVTYADGSTVRQASSSGSSASFQFSPVGQPSFIVNQTTNANNSAAYAFADGVTVNLLNEISQNLVYLGNDAWMLGSWSGSNGGTDQLDVGDENGEMLPTINVVAPRENGEQSSLELSPGSTVVASANGSFQDTNGNFDISYNGAFSVATSSGTSITIPAFLNGSQAADGTYTFDLPDTSAGLTQSLILNSDGSGSVEVAGSPSLFFGSGTSINAASNGNITAQDTVGDWTDAYTVSGAGAVTGAFGTAADGGITIDTSYNVGGGDSISSMSVDGQTFSGGNAGAFISGALGSIDQSQTSAGSSATSSALSTDFSNIAAGSVTGLSSDIGTLVADSDLFTGDAKELGYLAQILNLSADQYQWAPYFVGLPPTSDLTISSSILGLVYDPTLAQLQQALTAFETLPSVLFVQVEPPQPQPPGTVTVGPLIDTGGDLSNPLVLDLDGNGINLTPAGKSSAHFDIDDDGTDPQVSWVGPTNGILVFDPSGGPITSASQWFGQYFSANGSAPPANQSGFAALATLAQAGATSFNAATSLTDPTTGKLYWNEVEVWVDANGNGVTDPGELYTLAQLGITSISLASTTVNQTVNGNEVISAGSYTLSNGTTRSIDDVGLTTANDSGGSAGGTMSQAALDFVELAAAGLPAQAAGQASAAAAAIAAEPTSLASEISAITALQVNRYFEQNGESEPFLELPAPDTVMTYSETYSAGLVTYKSGIYLSENTAPQDVITALDAIGGAVTSVGTAANGVATAANAMSAAQTAAVIADTAPTASAIANALSAAETAETDWGNAIAEFISANATATAVGGLIATAQNDLSALAPANYNQTGNAANGLSYASSTDALLAAASFSGLQAGLTEFASVKDAFDKTLAAIAKSGNYGSVYIGSAGGTTTADGNRDLIIAGQGTETFVAGAGHDDFMFTASAGNDVIDGFQAGTTGDQLQFYGVGSGITLSNDGNGGTEITYGNGQSVDLAGVAPSALDLVSNIVGVSTISFAGVQTGGVRSLDEAQAIYDGLVHIQNITGSNYGDTLIGNTAGNILTGGLGNDTLEGFGGADTLNGGGGVNTVSYAWSNTGVIADLLTGTDSTGSQLFDIQNIIGTSFADTLIGDGNNNVLNGEGGNDTLIGGGGNDTYDFNRGYGQLTIENGIAANSTPSSVLDLGNIVPDDLWFSQSGNNLIIQVLGTNDEITVDNWFADTWSQLQAIEVSGGLQIGAAGVNSLVSLMAAYLAANPSFNPSQAQQLPEGISALPYFSSQPVTGSVPVAPNVVLDTEHADSAALPAQVASQMSQGLNTLNGQLGSVLSTLNSAISWSQQGKPVPGSGTTTYVYQPAGAPYPYVVTFTPNLLQKVPAGAQIITAMTPSTFYFADSLNGGTPGTVVGSTTAMDAAIDAVGDSYADIAPAATLSQDLIIADNDEQSALNAAVAANNANAGFDSSSAQTARSTAATAEAALGTAISAYDSVASDLSSAAAILQNNQALLNGILPPTTSTTTVQTYTEFGKTYTETITTTLSYSFYSSTDQNQFNALQNAENAAESALGDADAALGSALAAYGAFEGYSSAQVAGNGVNLTARAGGDLLIAAGSGFHDFVGSSGADTYVFGAWNDTSGGEVDNFKAGVEGDRLLLIPANNIVYLTDSGSTTSATFETGSGGYDTVNLTNVPLDSLSLYDNLIGVTTADFQNETHSVTVDLASVTPRAADGSVHITTLIGSNYGDTLIGDQDDNYILGGAGNDTLAGGAGDDTLNGGGGINTASFATDPQGAKVNLANGTAINGYGGADTLINIQNVIGSAAGNNTLIGNSAANVLIGGGAGDTLDGGGGADTLIAAGGAETLYVRGGADTLIAGSGSDTFEVASAAQTSGAAQPQNLIENFNPGTDKIDLSQLTSITSFADLDFSTVSFAGQSYLEVSLGSNLGLTLSGVTAAQLASNDFVFRKAAAPSLSTAAAQGQAGTPIALNISTALTDVGTSEALSVTIAGLSSGWTLSAGTKNSDGTWTLTPTELAGLTLIVPAGSFAGAANLSVTATATAQNDQSQASSTAGLALSVAGTATAPTLSVENASGRSGKPIALDITSALTATDGTEGLSINISGLPSGATLSAGTQNTDGSWTLTSAQLVGLTLTTPSSFSGNVNATVAATATETDGSAASSSAGLLVAVAPPDLTLSVQNASGSAGNAIALNITSELTGDDGAEGLSINISGLPKGASLSAGAQNPDGSWTLTPAELSGLSLLAPAGSFAGAATLTVTASANEADGSLVSESADLAVAIAGAATAPTLTAQSASGAAGSPIALDIASALSATDGTESLSLNVAGLPSGATLSAGTKNADGSWTLTVGQLSGLSLTVPVGSFAGAASLDVTSTAAETDGSTASASANLAVAIAGTATAPTLTVQNASGNAGSAIALDIASALTATDGTESLSLNISGVPSGATLSAGTKNADGSWTLTAAQLAALSLTVPAGTFAGTATLDVTSTATEEDGSTASASANLAVAIAGTATAPSLTVQSASGSAGGAIALDIASALTATDGTESLSLNISGVPSGATLSAGTENADGSWTLTAAQLSGLSLTVPAGTFAGAATLNVTSTATETDGSTASTSAHLAVTIAGVATAPTLAVQNASGAAGSSIALNIASALTATDGTESLSVNISGLPSGSSLSAGTQNADGSWTLSAAQLAGLSFIAPIAGGFSSTAALVVTATAAETDGSSASTSATLKVAIGAAATAPTLTVEGASGTAGSPIALDIASALTATDGTESLSLNISGVPSGATLSAGTKNADGSWTLTSDELQNLSLTIPAGTFAGTATLNVTSTATETDGSTASTSAKLAIAIAGAATAPALTVQNASGNAGSAIALNITSALTATDGTENLAINISGLPSGASLSAGTRNSDGSWTLSASQLAGLSLVAPPAGSFAGTATLTVTATAAETDGSTASTSANLAVAIGGEATAPALTVENASGAAGSPIALDIASTLTATDGTEGLSVNISGLPSGATLSAGTRNADGSWTLTPEELQDLSLAIPAGAFAGTATLNVTSTATEADGSTASTSANLAVKIAGTAIAPTLAVQNVSGIPGAPIALAISSALTATDGQEALSIQISGLPSGATLSAGTQNTDGSWTLTAAELTGLTLTVPSDGFTGVATLAVTSTATESDNSEASSSANFSLNVTPPSQVLSTSGTGVVLQGGAGNDTLIASGARDTLIAGSGHDTLIATGGVDTLFSNGSGNTLIGSGGDMAAYSVKDVTVNLAGGTAGVNGTDVSDTLVGFTYAAAFGSGDTLIGASNSVLWGLGSDDTLIGGNGDHLFGNGQGNTLVAGTSDVLGYSGVSNMTVNLATGTASTNGSTISDVLVGSFQSVNIGGPGAAINSYDTLIGGAGTESLATQSGNYNTLIGGSGTDLLEQGRGSYDVLIGGSGADILRSVSADNTLIAGSGMDTLENEAANSVYMFGTESGQATIVNGSSSNELEFGTGISDQDLWFTESGNNLNINVVGTSKQVTVSDWLLGGNYQLSEITAGGLEIDSQVSQLVQAMASYAAANPSFNPETATQMPNDPSLQKALAAAWH